MRIKGNEGFSEQPGRRSIQQATEDLAGETTQKLHINHKRNRGTCKASQTLEIKG